MVQLVEKLKFYLRYFKGGNVVHNRIIWISFLKLLALLLAFLVNYLLLHLIGIDDFGEYIEYYAMVFIVSVIGRLGLDMVAVRELAREPARFSDRSIVKILYASVVAGTMLVGVAIFATAGIFGKYTPVMGTLGIATAIVFSIMVISSEILRGRRFSIISTISNGIAMPAFIVVGALIPNLLSTKIDAAILFLAATTFACVTAMFLASWLAILPVMRKGETANFSNLWNLIQHLWPTSVLSMAGQRWVPVLILGLFSDPREIAIYAVGFQFANLVSFMMMASNVYAAPHYASLSAPSQHDKLVAYIRSVYYLNAISALAIAIPMIVLAGLIMKTYSNEFIGTGVILIFLVLGQLWNALGGHIGVLLTMTNNDKVRSLNAYIGFGSFIILALTLVPIFDALGASIAFMLSSLITAINGNLLLQKHVGVRAAMPF